MACCRHCTVSGGGGRSCPSSSCTRTKKRKRIGRSSSRQQSMRMRRAVVAKWEELPNTPMGLNVVSKEIQAHELADWIFPEHRPLAAMVFSMSYSGWQRDRPGYRFLNLPELQTVRIGVWQELGPAKTDACGRTLPAGYVVGCRATGIGQPGALQDLADDRVVGGGTSKGSCETNIVTEGTRILQTLLNRGATGPQITVVGYSLGGSAALCLATHFPGVRAVSFAGGAPATFPIRKGPGPSRAVHYTIVGDLISSHVDPAAATVVRVDKGYNNDWGAVIPHLSGRFLRTDSPPGKLGMTADAVDDAFVRWAADIRQGPATAWQIAKGIFSTLWKLGEALALVFAPPVAALMEGARQTAEEIGEAVTWATTLAACTNPIPGSRRDREGTCHMEKESEGAAICESKFPGVCTAVRIFGGGGGSGHGREDASTS